MSDQPEPIAVSPVVVAESVEARVTRWALAVGVAAAIVLGAVATWTTVGPIPGALALLVPTAIGWYVVTNREHDARKARDRAVTAATAAYGAKAAFGTARPVAPNVSTPSPFGGA